MFSLLRECGSFLTGMVTVFMMYAASPVLEKDRFSQDGVDAVIARVVLAPWAGWLESPRAKGFQRGIAAAVHSVLSGPSVAHISAGPTQHDVS